MNLQEIISRPNGSEYTTAEMTFVVESYIETRKDVRVDINVFKGIKNQNNPFEVMRLSDQFEKLTAAFNVAQSYLKS